MKKQTSIFILIIVLCILFLGCEAMAELFHGPKPEETYTVIFYANGATGTPPAAKTVTAGTAINLPEKGDLNKEAYIFAGWSQNSSGGTIYPALASVTVAGDMVFYAQWLDSSTPQYTVTFDGNGATSGSPPISQTVYSGMGINIPNQGTLVNSGKTFGGWNTLANGGGINYVANSVYTVTENVTLYAKWQSEIQYTVTYNANGAGGTAPDKLTVDPGTVIILPDSGNMTYQGRQFDGWNTSANGSGTPYAAGSSYTVNGNASFYAQWISVPITPPGETPAEQLAYIRSNAGDGVVYDIVVNTNEYLSPQTVSTMGRNITVNIHSANSADVKYIQLESAGHLFSVEANITLKLQDIVLRGINNNDRALISVSRNGKLILDSGSKITMNSNSVSTGSGYLESGGGVHIDGGTLEMNDGAEIIGNNAAIKDGGGIAVYSGNITMRGGLISENRGSNGGGIYINAVGVSPIINSVVTMNGGTISKNTASYGGGICIGSIDNRFTKRTASGSNTSGIIYGSDGGDNANTGSFNGAAIYIRSPQRKRELTLGLNDEISTLSNEGWE